MSDKFENVATLKSPGINPLRFSRVWPHGSLLGNADRVTHADTHAHDDKLEPDTDRGSIRIGRSSQRSTGNAAVRHHASSRQSPRLSRRRSLAIVQIDF